MRGISLNELKNKTIENFINKCKKIIEENPENLKLIPRDKNIDSLYSMGLTPIDVEEIICNLTIDDYYRGPSPDHAEPEDDIWEFLVKYEEFVIYIKLKLKETENNELVICISFHEAEYY